MALNIRITSGQAAVSVDDGLHFLMIGDFGTDGPDQKRVAVAMTEFVGRHSLKPDGLWFLGDNFYGQEKDGFSTESRRWRDGIEDMYPESAFPGPTWAVLGNHDYHDNEGGERVQLAYSGKLGVRWRMPAKWYRVDLGEPEPWVTFLCLDSNIPLVSGGMNRKTGQHWKSLTGEEAEQQLAWFKGELAKPRAPFTIVVGHHPMYSDGAYGDTEALISEWGTLLEEHQVHAYVCGHEHDLQHLELDGLFTSFVISGGGGAYTRDLRAEKRGLFGRKTHGFTHLHATRDALTFAHYNPEGELLHAFAKRQDGSFSIKHS